MSPTSARAKSSAVALGYDAQEADAGRLRTDLVRLWIHGNDGLRRVVLEILLLQGIAPSDGDDILLEIALRNRARVDRQLRDKEHAVERGGGGF